MALGRLYLTQEPTAMTAVDMYGPRGYTHPQIEQLNMGLAGAGVSPAERPRLRIGATVGT